jgi:hypothetical protein
MDRDDEAEEIEDNPHFPLRIQHKAEIEDIISLIRSHLVRMSPRELRSAASVLLALERLPFVTPGIDVSFGFQEPRNGGNYAWADLRISEESFSLNIGQHFYDPDVGGDTETQTAFEATEGDARCRGGIERWLETARQIADGSPISCEDYSDHESVDWIAGEVDGWETS